MAFRPCVRCCRIVEWNIDPDLFPGETKAEGAARMSRAIDATRQYRREYDDKLQRFKDRPLHDWTSHYADALRYLAKGRRPFRGTPMRPRTGAAVADLSRVRLDSREVYPRGVRMSGLFKPKMPKIEPPPPPPETDVAKAQRRLNRPVCVVVAAVCPR
jgi:hypothetical protein